MGGAGTDGGRAMEDLGHADCGDVATGVEDLKDGRGVGDFGDDV